MNELVCSIATATNADVIVLLENGSKNTLNELQTNVSEDFYEPSVIMDSEERFHCFCRNNSLDLSELHAESRISVRKFHIGDHKTLLALYHGPDIRNNSAGYRQGRIQDFAEQMRFVQKDKKTDKLILLGDFNMNPFDEGMNLPMGLNAMMTKACVQRGYRTRNEKQYDYYYNPMWSLFGDNTDGPAGTIYNTSNQGTYGWNMLDQVIIHHSTAGLFENVKILTETNEKSLLNNLGRPDSNNVSDHFPILVSFREDYNE